MHLGKSWLPAFDLLKQPFYPFFPIESCELILKVIVFKDTVDGRVCSLLLQNAGAKTVQCTRFVLRARDCSGGVSFAGDACTAMLRDEHLACGLSLLQLLL